MSSHEHQPLIPSNPSWVWSSGLHGASGILHPFLAIRDDPEWVCHHSSYLAGSGGLVLIKQFRPERYQVRSSLELDQGWVALMVVNFSTQESRVLPPANSLEIDMEFWSYDGVQANLLVDPESQTYTVTLTFPYGVCLYSSTSLAWQCWRFDKEFSWGAPNRDIPWEMKVANAYVNGRLFFADFVLEDHIPTINLMEINVDRSSLNGWRHYWRYSLQTQFTEFVDTPFFRMRGLTDQSMHQALNTRTVACRHRVRSLGNFQIVECMGELYAVIPTSLSEYLPMSLRRQRALTEVVHEYANFGLRFMPLQFQIVNMRGDGFVHGVLRILVPEDVIVEVGGAIKDYEALKTELERKPYDIFRLRYSCVAEGSVIWVALLHYVLQYDVVTGVSKTELIDEEAVGTLELEIAGDRAPYYRPSNMKP